MRLLRVAVEKGRWDLAAHTIVLATAIVLKNGAKPQNSQRHNPTLQIPGDSVTGRGIKTEGREFDRKKRRPQGQSKR